MRTTILGIPIDTSEGYQFLLVWGVVLGALLLITGESPKLGIGLAFGVFFTAAIISRIGPLSGE